MKNEIEKLANKNVAVSTGKPISRKEAIVKTGFIAVSAATTMLLLSSPKAHATSPCDDDRDHDRGSNHGSNHGNNNGGKKNP